MACGQVATGPTASLFAARTKGLGVGLSRPRASVARCALSQLERPTAGLPEATAGVRASVRYKTSFGEVLRLVGEGDALGSWSVPHSPSLAWTEDDVWVGNLDLAPGCYEFKVVVWDSHSGSVRWEPGGNKRLEVPAGPGQLLVPCQWGSASLAPEWHSAQRPQQHKQQPQQQQPQQQPQQPQQQPQQQQQRQQEVLMPLANGVLTPTSSHNLPQDQEHSRLQRPSSAAGLTAMGAAPLAAAGQHVGQEGELPQRQPGQLIKSYDRQGPLHPDKQQQQQGHTQHPTLAQEEFAWRGESVGRLGDMERLAAERRRLAAALTTLQQAMQPLTDQAPPPHPNITPSPSPSSTTRLPPRTPDDEVWQGKAAQGTPSTTHPSPLAPGPTHSRVAGALMARDPWQGNKVQAGVAIPPSPPTPEPTHNLTAPQLHPLSPTPTPTPPRLVVAQGRGGAQPPPSHTSAPAYTLPPAAPAPAPPPVTRPRRRSAAGTLTVTRPQGQAGSHPHAPVSPHWEKQQQQPQGQQQEQGQQGRGQQDGGLPLNTGARELAMAKHKDAQLSMGPGQHELSRSLTPHTLTPPAPPSPTPTHATPALFRPLPHPHPTRPKARSPNSTLVSVVDWAEEREGEGAGGGGEDEDVVVAAHVAAAAAAVAAAPGGRGPAAQAAAQALSGKTSNNIVAGGLRVEGKAGMLLAGVEQEGGGADAGGRGEQGQRWEASGLVAGLGGLLGQLLGWGSRG